MQTTISKFVWVGCEIKCANLISSLMSLMHSARIQSSTKLLGHLRRKPANSRIIPPPPTIMFTFSALYIQNHPRLFQYFYEQNSGSSRVVSPAASSLLRGRSLSPKNVCPQAISACSRVSLACFAKLSLTV